MLNELEWAQQRITALESEIDEMTVALSQAWDQLIPLLQEQSIQEDSLHSVLTLLDSLMVATECDTAAIYLDETRTWRSLPTQNVIPVDLMRVVQHGTLPNDVWQWENQLGEQWMFAPLLIDEQVAGVVGIGIFSASIKTTYTAVDRRLLQRIAERISGQMMVTKLAIQREEAAKTAHEMEIANNIQQSVQPMAPPDLKGLDLKSFWQPARMVGGDAWGWVQQDSGAICLFILDVAGKGLPAALGAISIHAAIRTALGAGMSPTEVLAMVNDDFYESYTATDLITTATIIRYNPNGHSFEQANAGHPPTLIHTNDQWIELGATMPPIGVLQGLEPQLQQLTLQPGDVFICYSDGFSEIETSYGLWGSKGIMNAADSRRHSAQAMLKAINTTAHSVQQSEENLDDQTLIIGRTIEEISTMQYRKTIPATIKDVSMLSKNVETWLIEASIDDHTVITLVVQELGVNIVEHGYQEKSGDMTLTVTVGMTSIIIDVIEQAPNVFVPPTEISMPDPLDLPEGGWGLYLIYQIMDEVNYKSHNGTNSWHLIKYR